MTAEQILAELRAKADEQTRKTFLRHGVQEPLYGVKIEHLKTIQKKVKKDHALSLELYRSGIADAQYLAGLIADEKKITPEDLKTWAKEARGAMVAEYTVPWIAAESSHGRELALEWIESPDARLQATGWATLANLVSLLPDDRLDLNELRSLLERASREIHKAPNRVAYAMNTYVISLGTYVQPLMELAVATGKAIGKITIDMNGTACKVPYSPDYIQKSIDRGRIGKKKKMARC